jgi:hypothetical protein
MREREREKRDRRERERDRRERERERERGIRGKLRQGERGGDLVTRQVARRSSKTDLWRYTPARS